MLVLLEGKGEEEEEDMVEEGRDGIEEGRGGDAG